MSQDKDFSFGSKAFNEYHHGRNKGARAKGDQAKRQAEALKKSLTKKGEREELERRRGEFEAEGAHLAQEQQAEDKALARILGQGAHVHALKIARPHGTFKPADVAELERNGWTVHPAGTVPAKLGAALPAIEAPEAFNVELNPAPADPMTRILGPELEARAVVVSGPEPMTPDTVDAWRRAGYDVSPAPKKLREGKARVNPGPSGAIQRKLYDTLKKAHGAPRSVEELADLAKIAPEEALASLGRLEALGLAHPAGSTLFGALWAPGALQRGLFGDEAPQIHRGLFDEPAGLFASNPGDGARFHAFTAPPKFWSLAEVEARELVADLGWIRHKHGREFKTDAALIAFIEAVLNADDLAKIKGESRHSWLFFKVTGGECAIVELVAFKTSGGEKAYRISSAYTMSASPLRKALERGNGLDANPDSGGRGPKAAHPGTPNQPLELASRCTEKHTPPPKTRKNPTPGAKPCQEAPGEGTRETRSAQPGGMVRKPTPSAPQKAQAPNPKEGPDAPGLVAAWERWTGSKSSGAFVLNLKNAGSLPASVVLLGRLAKLITAGGEVQDFAEKGPYLVTDAAMRRVWLVSEKARRFDLDVSKGIICYHAKKTKFGDRSTVEYVHAFRGKARAAMEGQTGELTGTFRLTPRGIEG